MTEETCTDEEVSNKVEANPKDIILGELSSLKTRLENIDVEINRRAAEFKVFEEEKLRLQGSYKSFLELAVKLKYINLS